MLTTVSQRANAKLIISGEYSVCHGAMAIGVPLPLLLKASWKKNSTDNFVICTKQHHKNYTKSSLIKRAKELLNHSATNSPDDLIVITIHYLLQKFDIEIEGLSLVIESAIPECSGLGSSSALIYTIIQSVNTLFTLGLSVAEVIKQSKFTEHYQHGHSSGLDISIIAHNQPLAFYEDSMKTELIRIKPRMLAVAFSGKAQSSTADCVDHINSLKFPINFWQSFDDITREIKRSLERGDDESLIKSIQANHQLLLKLSVTPKLVADFISECERFGGGAKICGAGTLRGNGAGVILIIINNEKEKYLQLLCNKYNYDLQYIQLR